MIIQTKEQLSYFLDKIKDSSFFIEAIPVSWNESIQESDLSFLYIYVLEEKSSFILVFNHSEKFHNIYDYSIIEELNTNNKKYTFNKKNILHFFELKELYDLKMYSYLNNTLDKLNFNSNYIYTFYDNGNYYIPLIKHKENYDGIINRNYSYVFKDNNINIDAYYIYNNLISDIVKLEKNYISISNADKYFEKVGKINKLYSNYNLYTTTGRPTNSYKRIINLLALDKNRGHRKIIKSSLDYLLEFDFNSFHVRLIADKVLGLDYSDHDDLYLYFANSFSINKNRDEIKKRVFELLYSGKIDDRYLKHEFFSLLNKAQDKIYDFYKKNGFIKTLLFKRKLKVKGKANKGKVFNYFIQSLETENNFIIINKLNTLLENYKSKLILYTYDSFLFDFVDNEQELTSNIKNILKYNAHIKIGRNYDELKEIKNE